MKALNFIKAILLVLSLLMANASFSDSHEVKKNEKSEFKGYSITNISFLTGSTYALNDPNKDTLRFDHASNWVYGDNFFFFDITAPFDKGTFVYGEWSSRLSLSKMTLHPIHFLFIKDVLIAGELNLNGVGMHAYLIGPGFNLDIPGFKFFQFNIYSRKDGSQPGSTYQLTWVWNLPFNFFTPKLRMVFSGFCDWAGKQNNTLVDNLLVKPQLLLDVGNLVWHKKSKLFAGIRYVYWHNKLGIRGVNESVPEAMVTWQIS